MNRCLLYLTLALAFAGLSVVLNPFQFDLGNSGRYLLPVAKDLDTSLFAVDPDVEALRRFGSGFYVALSAVLVLLDVSAGHLAAIMMGLFLCFRFLLAIALMFLAHQLTDTENEGLLLTLILLVWCSFPLGVAAAGVAIGSPTMNHASVSEVVMVLSIALLVGRRFTALTMINAADVWVHPLMALHRMVAFVPAMIAGGAGRRYAASLLGSLLVFSASAAAYKVALAPPSMNHQETEIFLAAKGVMVHTSPFAQPITAWVELAALLVLAWCVTHRLAGGLTDDRPRLLWRAIGSGTAAALVLSTVAHFTQHATLVRLQPMRMLELPWFACVAVVAIGTSRAMRANDPAWPWLAATIAVSSVHGGIQIVMLPAAATMVAAQTLGDRNASMWGVSRAAFAALAFAALALAIGSGRSVHFDIGVALLIAVLVVSALSLPRWASMTAVLAVAIAGGALSSWIYFRVEPAESTGRPRVDHDYIAALDWIRDNTEVQARFATEPGMAFFRARALRTSVNEAIPAVVWVDPKRSIDGTERIARTSSIFEASILPWLPGELEEMSHQLGFDYALTRQRSFVAAEPEFSSGPFHVFRIR